MSIYNSDTLFKLNDQVAVITGGGTGIGASIARGFIENGAKRVYIVGRRLEKLVEKADELNKLEFDGEVVPVQGDVSSRETVDLLVQYFKGREESIDILVNNAGFGQETREEHVPPIAENASAAEKLSHRLYYNNFAEWSDHFSINVTGPYFLAAGLVPLLAKAAEKGDGQGNIINVSSIAGLHITTKNSAAYQSSKAGLLSVSQVLANRLDGSKIRVNTISPGLMRTEMGQDLINRFPELTESVPVGFVAEKEQIVGLALYLASKAGKYTHGANHIIDGGRLLRIPTTY
jgi:NAD(P)-dependent dehydrogenase (short-subunit alcohol dehydrogenase family)